jgi:hypothetical protein
MPDQAVPSWARLQNKESYFIDVIGGNNVESLEAKVVKSLDGEDNELYNFIPYLLQDLWEIGSSPEVIINMVKKHIGKSNISVLDLG